MQPNRWTVQDKKNNLLYFKNPLIVLFPSANLRYEAMQSVTAAEGSKGLDVPDNATASSENPAAEP